MGEDTDIPTDMPYAMPDDSTVAGGNFDPNSAFWTSTTAGGAGAPGYDSSPWFAQGNGVYTTADGKVWNVGDVSAGAGSGGLIGSLLQLIGADPSDPGNQKLAAGVLSGAGSAALNALNQAQQQRYRSDLQRQQAQAAMDQLNAQNAFISARQAVPAYAPGRSLTMGDFGLMRGSK